MTSFQATMLLQLTLKGKLFKKLVFFENCFLRSRLGTATGTATGAGIVPNFSKVVTGTVINSYGSATRQTGV
jgi:hypothetical protein